MHMHNEFIFQIFFLVWIALGVGNWLFFWRCKNAPLKRKWFPRICIAASVLFWGFMILSGMPILMALFVIPVITLIMVLNVKFIRFCDSCGCTLYRTTFAPLKYCSGCGANLALAATNLPGLEAPPGEEAVWAALEKQQQASKAPEEETGVFIDLNMSNQKLHTQKRTQDQK